MAMLEVLKPLGGWRVLIGEIGVVTVGVLIALGAQQWADERQWKREAKRAMGAIDVELARDHGVFDERTMVQPCLNQRLADLSELVRAARRSGQLPDIGEIGRPPLRPIVTSAWTTAVNSGLILHFDRERREFFSAWNPQIAAYEEEVGEEQLMWASLKVLEDNPGPISEAIIADVAGTLGRLHFRSYFNGVTAAQVSEGFRSRKIEPDYMLILDRPGVRSEIEALRAKRPICQPLMVDGRPFAAPKVA